LKTLKIQNFKFLLSTAVGITCKDGVVLAVEKIVTSKLYEPGVNKRVFIIDQHIGMVIKTKEPLVLWNNVKKLDRI